MQDDLLEEIHAKYRMTYSKTYMKNTGGLTRGIACKTQDGLLEEMQNTGSLSLRNTCKIENDLLEEMHAKCRMTYSKERMQNAG